MPTLQLLPSLAALLLRALRAPRLDRRLHQQRSRACSLRCSTAFDAVRVEPRAASSSFSCFSFISSKSTPAPAFMARSANADSSRQSSRSGTPPHAGLCPPSSYLPPA